jgi:predicted RND superfamily exporter protein
MNERIAAFLVHRRLPLFFLSLLIILGCAAGLPKLKYTGDYKIFFAPDDPYLVSFENLQDTFTRADNIGFIIIPKQGDLFNARTLEAIRWLTRESWTLPYSIRVDSMANYQHTAVDGDDLTVNDLIPPEFKGDAADIARIRDIAMHDPMVLKRLVNPAGDTSVMAVTLELPADQQVGLPTLMEGPEGVYALADRFRAEYPELDLHITGVAMINYMLGTVASRDAGILMPILALVVLVLIGIMTRSFSNTVVTFLVIITSVVATMGLTSMFGLLLDNVSAVAPMVILTLAVADSVHLLNEYSTKLREGFDKESAMRIACERNVKAVFFTSITTAIGFLGMTSIDSPPFVRFGIIASVGVMIAWALTHTMLPQLAIWLSRPHKGEPEVHEDKIHSTVTEWVMKNPRKVFISTLLISAVSSLFILRNDLNDDNIGYFSKDMPVRVATETGEAKGFGFNSIEYVLDSGEEYGITDPAYLAKVERFVEYLRQQPEVVHVASFTEVLKTLNKTMNGDSEEFFRLPASRELASQYLLMYEMSLPQGVDLNNQIDTRKSKLRITVSTRMMKARQNLAVEARASGWLEAQYPELAAKGVGPTIMFSHLGQSCIESVVMGTVSSLIIICLCMMFSFGSVRLGLMAMLPNIFPSLVTIGLWGLFVGEVNMGVAVIMTIANGIIVDDTIHLFTKFADGLRKGLDTEDAIRYCFAQAGKGVLITTVVLSAGFAMLMFSDFTVNNTLGIMVSGTIAIALLFDLLFLPSVLKIFPVDPKSFRANAL